MQECLICESCVDDFRTKKKCPSCATWSKNIDFFLHDSNQNIILFKKGLNHFFMEVVHNLCFSNKRNLPDDEVIDLIILNLMPRAISDKDDSQTIRLDLNLNKSIKTTLFQLLLNYKKDEVKDHLDRILSKSSRYLKENYNSEDLIDLKLMLINSIEDNLYSKKTFITLESNRIQLDIELGIT